MKKDEGGNYNWKNTFKQKLEIVELTKAIQRITKLIRVSKVF